ncbi:MAG: hypothetical protein COU27_01080 [Candidatus Levybacteria bacterium CG10_big_fil_rev_8_21_14_0_10_36_7]|nr:MAG: hypothetical protein COU27_01080 [Candidatus Levybacteria bacterium CG10_big_fil_rev_8_21_14_0_10_36_7]
MNSTISIFLFLSLLFFALGALRNWKKEKKQSGLVSQTQIAGFLLWQGFDHWINYILYPVALGVLGLVDGTIFMIGLTLLTNACYLFINNKTEEDWSFMLWITNLRDNDSMLWPYRYAKAMKVVFIGKAPRRAMIKLIACVRHILRKKSVSNAAGFLFLSVWKDSFYAINFLYHKKADLRDMNVLGLYLLSHIICNLVWVPVAGGMALVGKFLFEFVTAL